MPPTHTIAESPSLELRAEKAHSVSQRVAAMIAEKLPPERIVERLDQLIHATRTTRHGVEIDSRAVESGVKLWLAYVVGLPIQRQEVVSVNLNADSSLDIEERLANSPALREQLRRSLAAADAAAGVVEVS